MCAIFARDVRHLARVSARSQAKTEPIFFALAEHIDCQDITKAVRKDNLRRNEKRNRG